MNLPTAAFAVSAFLAVTAAAAPAFADAADAQRMLKNATSNGIWKNNYTGEQFAWNVNASGLHSFLQRYQATKDTAYLDAGVSFFDQLLGKMQTGPDGYKGFIGPFIYNNKVWCDVHVGDALMFEGLLDFAAAIARDPALKEKYGAKAMEYAQSVEKNFYEKWDKRGTFHQDGPFGFYVAWDQYGQPGQFTGWKPDATSAESSDNSLPFNKQIDCGVVFINLWHITGDEKYKHRAEQLFGYMKSRMQNYNGAYHWNYWEPAGQWDLGATPADIKAGEWNPAVASKTMRHWINVHGQRNYQENEMDNIVKAYNAGIVFTEADIKGMIQTNLKVMWNGDENHPLWTNSNADLMKEVGKPEFYHAANAPEKAGKAWSVLGQFDPEIRKLSGRRRGGGGGEGNSPAPSFDRRDVTGNVEIPEVYAQFPLGNIRTMHMACVLPSIFASGDNAAVCCKLLEPGDLEVALYSPDGKTRIATLKQGHVAGGHDGREGVNYFMFNGSDPASGKAFDPGNYRIRWTVAGDGYREFPITIQPKK